VTTLKKLFATMGIVGMLGGAAGSAQAGLVLNEGFDGAVPPPGWAIDNLNSTPGGTTDWFKGDTSVFTSQAGAPDAYAAANFNATAFGGNIRDWLISPTVFGLNGDILSFFTRREDQSAFPVQFPEGSIQVRMCVGAACVLPFTTTNFSTLLVPSFTPGINWGQTQVALSGIASGGQNVRIAFGYICNDTSINCDYVGLDTIQVVPEPSAMMLLALGLTTMGWHLRRRSAR